MKGIIVDGMKKVGGFWIPFYDDHFEDQLKNITFVLWDVESIEKIEYLLTKRNKLGHKL